MTPEQQRLYGRGYSAGRRGSWPAHRPPSPPVEQVAAIMAAARELRDAVDAELAVFDPDDPMAIHLGPLIDRFDQAMTHVSDWLTKGVVS